MGGDESNDVGIEGAVASSFLYILRNYSYILFLAFCVTGLLGRELLGWCWSGSLFWCVSRNFWP